MAAKSPDRAAETLNRIVDAGIAVFAGFGYRQASMDLFAEHARLSRQGLYNHVANKEALFALVVEALQQRSIASVEAEAQTSRDAGLAPPGLLAAVLAGRMRYLRDVLRGSRHMAELTDEQGRQCGPIVAAYNEHFRQWTIGLIDGERAADRLILRPEITSAELADDSRCIALGVLHALPEASFQDYRDRIERILTRLINGGRP